MHTDRWRQPGTRGARNAASIPAMLSALVLTAGAAAAETPSPRAIAAQVTPAVVSIVAFDQWGDELGGGTGFLLDAQGTFVTNHHVLENAASLEVELSSGERFTEVYSLAVDAERDLAVLSIPAAQTPAVVLGSDLELEVGDTVYVMGNPLGFDRTFSHGMVSAKRSIDGSEVIQLSAPVSPGSSGGPVMNERGEVVGIATWSIERGQNLTLALPIRYLAPMLALHRVPVPYEGRGMEITPLLARELPASRLRRVARIDPRSTDAWESEVLEDLALIERIFRDIRLRRSHEPVLGELEERASSLVSMTLQGGSSYVIAAACDSDCDDLELFLHRLEEQVLTEFRKEEGLAFLEVVPGETAQATLRVRMASCYAGPCRFGVAVFRAR